MCYTANKEVLGNSDTAGLCLITYGFMYHYIRPCVELIMDMIMCYNA